MADNMIITISRLLGSGGSYVGKMVADRLGIKYLDREILQRLSACLQEEEDVLSEREERISTFWERVTQTFCLGVTEPGYTPPPLRVIPDEELFFAEARIIRELTASCNAVLVGRAGFYILRDRPRLVKVFVHAPMEFRVRRIMELYDMQDADKVVTMIHDADQQRGKFVRAIAKTEWTDARNYDLCIDTAKSGLDTAIDLVCTLSEQIRS